MPLELIYGYKIVDLEHPKSKKDPKFYAILKKSSDEEVYRRIPLDLFVCAGGAKDRMRDKIFGML